MPRVGLLEAADHPQRGRLAAPRRAEQAEELAFRDVEGKVVDRGDVSEQLGNALESNVDLGHVLTLPAPRRRHAPISGGRSYHPFGGVEQPSTAEPSSHGYTHRAVRAVQLRRASSIARARRRRRFRPCAVASRREARERGDQEQRHATDQDQPHGQSPVDQGDRECAARHERAPQVHQQHGLAVPVSDVDQPVVDVLLVGVRDPLAAPRPPNDRERRRRGRG